MLSFAQIATDNSGNVAIACSAANLDYTLTVDYNMYVPEIYSDYSYSMTSVADNFSCSDLSCWASIGNGPNYPTVMIGSPYYTTYNSSYSVMALELYGDLNVEGYITSYSDKRLKKNIKNLGSSSIFDKFSKFESKSYQFLDRSEMLNMLDKEKIPYRRDTLNLKNKKELKDFKQLEKAIGQEGLEFIADSLVSVARPVSMPSNRDSYGFLAQEVEKVFPELVHMDVNGLYTIDYVSFIPLLFQATKELKSENNLLRQENEELRVEIEAIKDYIGMNKIVSRSARVSTEETSDELPQETLIEIQVDNTTYLKVSPNPFEENAELHYNIPSVFASAMINVFDINGSKVKTYSLSDFGIHSISVTSSEYATGLYTCALIVDGKVSATAKMMIKN